MSNKNVDNVYYDNGENTKILCIECMKGKLIHDEKNHAQCNNCNTKFLITGENEFVYL